MDDFCRSHREQDGLPFQVLGPRLKLPTNADPASWLMFHHGLTNGNLCLLVILSTALGTVSVAHLDHLGRQYTSALPCGGES